MLTAASAPMTACRAAAMPVTRAVRAFARSDITAPCKCTVTTRGHNTFDYRKRNKMSSYVRSRSTCVSEHKPWCYVALRNRFPLRYFCY